ncbi:MAG: MBL fold metallo-hydrolase [Variibacter sp.]|nr:MBL fold metallo-hydrolase [Variibacter sp.]
MATLPPFTFGLHRMTERSYAYMQPDGSWGLNNTMLFVDHGQSLLVDTLCDLPLTRRMLAIMAEAEPAARKIDKVLLTHWHCDHVFGASADELADSRIIASRICTDYMANNPPKAWVGAMQELQGDARRQMNRWLAGRFDFTGVRHRPPDEVFEGTTEIRIGDSTAIVIETAPSHTRSDSVVFFPDDGTAHTGDLVAIDRHVSMQYPGIANLVEATELMIGWHADLYVTGHGPVARWTDVCAYLEYLRFIQDRLKTYFDRGLSVDEATDELLRHLGPYRSLRNPQALYFTVKMGFCELAGDTENFARRNNPEFAATVWRVSHELPAKHPELFAQFASH